MVESILQAGERVGQVRVRHHSVGGAQDIGQAASDILHSHASQEAVYPGDQRTEVSLQTGEIEFCKILEKLLNLRGA